METEVSAELLRLLSILSDCPSGASLQKLAVIHGVKPSITYRAVVVDLVHVQRENCGGTYLLFLSGAGRKLLDSSE
jgi:hypothetical protein